MKNLTTQCHDVCQTVLQRGDIAIDATAGNGHDTLFLARQVGLQGVVYSFDLQLSAIEATAKRVEQAGINNVTLLQEDHACLQDFVLKKHRGWVAVVMFNLGYLPGGDKSLVTQEHSTLSAIKQSLELLRPEGLLTVLAYTGHAGGKEETNAVRHFLENLSDEYFKVTRMTAQKESLSPPQLFVVRKSLL